MDNNNLPQGLISNTQPEQTAVDIYAGAEQDRLLPRQIISGAMRGKQMIGRTGAALDSVNNRIVLSDTDGAQVGFGTIPGTDNGEFGFFSTDADGTLIFKLVNGTLYMFDADTGTNTLQLGVLPDGSTNLAIAKTGNSVVDAFV